jgi:hypothetical protein
VSYTAPPVIRKEFPDRFTGAFVELRNPTRFRGERSGGSASQ